MSTFETTGFETITVEAGDGPVGRVTLNRPDKLNPLSTQTLNELAAAFHALDGVAGLKVVIVSGAGRAFSAGADVSFFASGSGSGSGSASAGDPRENADAGRLMVESLDAGGDHRRHLGAVRWRRSGVGRRL